MTFKNIFSINQKKRAPREEKKILRIGMMSFHTVITFMERSTLSISLNSKNKEIKIKVPFRVTNDEAINFALSKQDWILRKFQEYDKKHQNHIARSYHNGSVHLLLGEKITLNIIISNKRTAPLLENGVLTLHVLSEDKIKAALKKWYTKIAPATFTPIIAPIITTFFKKYNKSPRLLIYKYVSSYWGVCTSSGEIRLNIELLRAPKECIEYIIAHELCHLVHQNHSQRFYAHLTEFMPDWKQRKALLEKSISCKD